MKFDDLDAKMRKFETINDTKLPSDVYMIVRVDGRGFTQLTKKELALDKPYDTSFNGTMVYVTQRLMDSGFKCLYGYTQSDEISILISPDCTTFDRKLRKINSVMAGTASAVFTYDMDTIGVFDARTFMLPNDDLVVDYFRWRAQDALRNSLNSWCYWTLRDNEYTASQATKVMSGMSVQTKHDMLHNTYGINFNDIPTWQKNGVGVYNNVYMKDGENPLTGEITQVERRELVPHYDLPRGDEYGEFIRGLLK